MELKVQGIPLKRTQYRDNTAIVTIFTAEFGIIQAQAYGIHSMKNGVSSGIQVFTFGEFTLSFKNDRYSIKSAEVIESFGRLSSSYAELCTLGRLGKAALSIFSESSRHSRDAFDLLYSTLSFLAYSDMNADDAYLYFLLHAFNISGQCPSVTNCAICGTELFQEPTLRFSYEHGGAICSTCIVHGTYVSKLALEAMRRMLLLPVHNMGKVKLTCDLKTELLNLLEGYYKFWY